MLRALVLMLVALLAAVPASAVETRTCFEPHAGIAVPGADDNPCPGSELLMTFDGGAIDGCAWQYGGVVSPDYGAWAEGYEGTGEVCGIRYWFTDIEGYQHGQTLDAYVYASDGENPSEVLSVTTGIDPGPVALWYDYSSHDVDIADTPVNGPFFVAYWGAWPGARNGWFTCCDLDGPTGMPRTNIAPGLGYPTGWHHPSVVFGPTENIGIGAYLRQTGVPVAGSSWGSIKALYR